MDDKRRLILDQALALVDERGLAAMSMRAVAERVGLTSMALYPYVGGKDALLDGLVDLLHLELGTAVGVDVGEIDWRQRLRALGRAVRALAHAHPGAFPLLLNRAAAGAAASWLTAALRGVLHNAGVPPARVPRMARMICAFLIGYTTGEVTGGLPAASVDSTSPSGARSAPPESTDRRLDADDSEPSEQPAALPAAAVLTGSAASRVAASSPGSSGSGAGSGVAAERELSAGEIEFDADLEDLVRLVEVAVRVG